MAFRTLKVLAFVSSLAVTGTASPAQACCWLFGGGWGAFRPLTWGSYYRGGWGGYNCCSGGDEGYGYANSYGGGCCGVGTGCCGSSCSSGCCGSQSLYGPGCDSCSQCGYSSGSCGNGCCGAYYGGSSDCCSSSVPTTSDPLPTPNSAPGDDNFRSRSGAPSSIPASPPSSIPANPPTNTPDPTYNPNSNAPEYNINRGTQDPFPNNGAGTDAVPFEQPRQPAPGDPLDPNLRDIHFEIEPLEVNTLVNVAYRPNRERVHVWSSRSQVPHIAAKPLPAANAGWEPVQDSNRVAQR